MSDAKQQEESPWEDAYGARFVTVEELGSRVVKGQIERGEWVQVFNRSDASLKDRLALYIVGGRKPLILNKTSAGQCASAWGPVAKDGQTWNGKHVLVRGGRINSKPALLVTPAPEGAAT